MAHTMSPADHSHITLINFPITHSFSLVFFPVFVSFFLVSFVAAVIILG